MISNRLLVHKRLRSIFSGSLCSNAQGPLTSRLTLFIHFDSEIFEFSVSTERFYRKFESIFQCSLNRELILENKPVTNLELKIFEEALLNQDMRFVLKQSDESQLFQPGQYVFQVGSPALLADTLKWEHPLAIALVFSQLGNPIAVKVLEALPMELRAEVIFGLIELRGKREFEWYKNIFKYSESA